MQLPGILCRLPYGPPLSPQGGRQPAGIRGRGERRFPEAPPGLQVRRLRGYERRGVGLRTPAERPERREDSGDRHPRGDQGFLYERRLRLAARTGALPRQHDRRPPAAAGRGADARQGRGGRGDRTLDGRDPDDGLLADVRSRRTGRPGARQQLHEDDLQQAASAFQPCREGQIPAGIDLQARAGPDRAAGGRAQALGPARLPRRLSGRPPGA